MTIWHTHQPRPQLRKSWEDRPRRWRRLHRWLLISSPRLPKSGLRWR